MMLVMPRGKIDAILNTCQYCISRTLKKPVLKSREEELCKRGRQGYSGGYCGGYSGGGLSADVKTSINFGFLFDFLSTYHEYRFSPCPSRKICNIEHSPTAYNYAIGLNL